jgi:hypothetical protein
MDWSLDLGNSKLKTQNSKLSLAGRAVFYLLCACLATWPLILRLPTDLPLGSESSATVPLFNLWTLRWNVDRLLAGYAGYWDAPIFYPAGGAFALSEPQPLTGLLFAPFYLLSGNSVLAYDLVLLLILAGNGLSANYLLTRLGVARGAALLGGVLALGLPFVSHELGVLQLAALFPIFMALAMLAGFIQRPTLRPALGLGIWAAATFLTCEYYGLFLNLFLLLGLPIFARRSLLRRETIGNLLISGAVVGLLLLPVLPAQVRFTAAFTRSAETIAQNSAQLVDYLSNNPASWGAAALPHPTLAGGSGQPLYPGTILLLLAMIGVAAAWRSGQRRWVIFCLAGAGVALLASLGLHLQVAGWQPYEALRALYPGFRQLRSPFRLGVFVQIFLLILAGFGLGWLWRVSLGRWLAVGLCTLGVLETLTIAVPSRTFSEQALERPWVGWLAAQPAGAAAIVPFPASGAVADYEPTALAMLQALEHRHPLANGYSGLFPAAYSQLREAMQTFPDNGSIAQLRTIGATYLVVDRAWADREHAAQRMQQYADLQLLFNDDAVSIFRLVAH